MGGDEFTVILSKITEQRDVALVAAKIFESITRTFLLAGHEFLIGVSIGISIFPTDADNEEALITKADTAMYVVKNNKGINYGLHFPDREYKETREQRDFISKQDDV
jgi:diguanylate cyclase (GGDEF)-like protein